MEDQAIMRMMVEGILDKWDDVRLHQFEGPDDVEAFAATLENPFILVTDMNIPEPVGGELITTLRGLPRGDQMFAVVLSATQDDEKIRNQAPHADKIIEKPADVSGLTAVLEDILMQGRGKLAVGDVTTE